MGWNLPVEQLNHLEDFLQKHFGQILRHGSSSSPGEAGATSKENQGHFQLLEAIKYSLFSGGKRFRPAVGFLLGNALGLETSRLLPWLSAVECIHTYSLIHDDLPSMDNDTLRRGKPTNHVVFGEATALLAGDALLTEAFSIISEYYQDSPKLGLQLVQILALASGVEGMVGGQAMDLGASLENSDLQIAETIHHLKTGALIRSVAEGLGVLAEVSPSDQARLTQFGAHLGYAFQLKDDLLDFDPQVNDPKNLACHLGLGKTKDLLALISKRAEEQIQYLGHSAGPLLKLIEFNVERSH